MKRLSTLLGGLALGAVMVFMPSAGHASIIGGPHDFSTSTNYYVNGQSFVTSTRNGVTSTNVCGACHTIHHLPDPARGPLWVHTPTAQTFKTYDQAGSETFPSGITVSLGSSSKACLSCHDGSVAINSQDSLSGGVITTTNKLGSPVFISPNAIPIEVNGSQDDLTHMHPIGFSYQTAIINMPSGDLNQPSAGVPGTGGTIATVMLKNGNVECSSCHDIHRTQGNSMNSGIFTIVSGQNLCLTCHNK